MFDDRYQAGEILASYLTTYRGTDAYVFGIARGGVVVASVCARVLKLPLDVLVIKKISSPYNKEFAIGALAPDGVYYVDWKLSQREGVDEQYINKSIESLGAEIKQREQIYRKGRKSPKISQKRVILIDDGVATGATIIAAIKWLKRKKVKQIVIAVPLMSLRVYEKLKSEGYTVVSLKTPSEFSAVGQFYHEFQQVEDSEVIQLLRNG